MWILCWWSYKRRGIKAGGVGEEEDEREEKQLRRAVILVCLPTIQEHTYLERFFEEGGDSASYLSSP